MARVLVVDDEPDILNLVDLVLRSRGHEVTTAPGPFEALYLLDTGDPPDVLVCDVAMPGMTGLDLAVELRGRSSLADLPIIFLSARVTPLDIDAGQAVGAGYVRKPFAIGTLLDAVETAAGQPDGEPDSA